MQNKLKAVIKAKESPTWTEKDPGHSGGLCFSVGFGNPQRPDLSGCGEGSLLLFKETQFCSVIVTHSYFVDLA